MNLQNNVAIVIATTFGLVLATCKALVVAGAYVVDFDLDKSRLDGTPGNGAGRNKGIAVDVSNEGSVKAGVGAVMQKRGRLHIVVNCAGIVGPGKTLSIGELFQAHYGTVRLVSTPTGTVRSATPPNAQPRSA